MRKGHKYLCLATLVLAAAMLSSAAGVRAQSWSVYGGEAAAAHRPEGEWVEIAVIRGRSVIPKLPCVSAHGALRRTSRERPGDGATGRGYSATNCCSATAYRDCGAAAVRQAPYVSLPVTREADGSCMDGVRGARGI
jgi:hypothetical protein